MSTTNEDLVAQFNQLIVAPDEGREDAEETESVNDADDAVVAVDDANVIIMASGLITKDHVSAFRKATKITFASNFTNDESFIIASKEKKDAAFGVNILKMSFPVDAVLHNNDNRLTPISATFEIEANDSVWQTVTRILRNNDRLELKWLIGIQNDTLANSNIVHDELRLTINRFDTRGRGTVARQYEFILGTMMAPEILSYNKIFNNERMAQF